MHVVAEEERRIYQVLYRQIAGKVGIELTNEFVVIISKIQWEKFMMIIRHMSSH